MNIKINNLKNKKEELKRKILDINNNIIKLKEEKEKLKKVKKVFIQSSIIGRNNTKERIENIVTDGLKVIHEHKMNFKIVDVSSYGKSGCNFKIEKNNHKLSLNCFGGGIRNIISTILRFIFAEYSVPKINIPLILDEVGSNLSKEYPGKFGQLLYTFSHKFNRQVILITHQEKTAEYSDKLFKIINFEDKSIIEEIYE